MLESLGLPADLAPQRFDPAALPRSPTRFTGT
jgi:hypothetical protein